VVSSVKTNRQKANHAQDAQTSGALSRQITIATTWDAVEQLRKVWDKLCTNPNADLDFFRFVCTARKVLQPHVVHIHDGDGNDTLVIARVERDSLTLRLGYLPLVRIPIRCLTIIHGGVIGYQDGQTAATLREVLISSCAELCADCIKVSYAPLENSIYDRIRRDAGMLGTSHCTHVQAHWITELPRSLDQLLGSLSGGHRKHLRRTLRNMPKSFSGNVRVALYQRIDDVPLVFRDLGTIANLTYQYRLNAGFVDSPETRARLEVEAQKGWLRIFVLYIHEEPVAYWWGQRYKQSFVSSAMGYDPQYARHSPGTYLLVRALEQLCEEGVLQLDFGLGDALYKRQFGTTSYTEGSFYLFPSSVRGVVLNCTASLASGIEVFTKALAGRMGLLTTVKGLWRSQLRRSSGVE
jgi:hypothetical protein